MFNKIKNWLFGPPAETAEQREQRFADEFDRIVRARSTERDARWERQKEDLKKAYSTGPSANVASSRGKYYTEDLSSPLHPLNPLNPINTMLPTDDGPAPYTSGCGGSDDYSSSSSDSGSSDSGSCGGGD